MNISWKRVKPLSSPAIVDETIKKYGIQISQALMDCIKEYNGGSPTPNYITASDGEEYDIKHLLSFNQSDPENFHRSIGYFVDHYDGAMVPFAIDSASNYFCEQNGQILVWVQEDETIVKAFASFDEFLSALHE